MIEILKFSAGWCTPCKVLSATLKDVEGITHVDIDADRQKAIDYNVRSVPTLVFLKDGQEVQRKTGLMSLGQFQDILDNLNKQ
jgi:thioredoxin 1